MVSSEDVWGAYGKIDPCIELLIYILANDWGLDFLPSLGSHRGMSSIFIVGAVFRLHLATAFGDSESMSDLYRYCTLFSKPQRAHIHI